MYRCLLLVLMVQLVAGGREWCRQHNGVCHHYRSYHGNHDKDGDFHDLSWEVVRLDRKAQRICKENTNYTKESFHDNFYKLTVDIQNFAEEDVTVKLKHRVLFIQAYKPDGANAALFSEFKVLPDFVKGKDGSWSLADSVLSIFMPYTRDIKEEFTLACETQIDETVVTLPKRSASDWETTTETDFNENIY